MYCLPQVLLSRTNLRAHLSGYLVAVIPPWHLKSLPVVRKTNFALCAPPYKRALVPSPADPPRFPTSCGMSGDGTPVYEDQAMRDAVTASVAAAYHGVSAKRKRDEESLEKQKREFAQEVEKVRTDAAEAAAKVKEDAETEAAEIRRVASAERAALDAEKAAMEQTYEFQTKKVHLDVGGHKFTTSLPTLTSVPDTYLEVMFSGRYPLAADPDGEFFIDRNGDLFRHILSYLRDPGRDE